MAGHEGSSDDTPDQDIPRPQFWIREAKSNNRTAALFSKTGVLVMRRVFSSKNVQFE